MKKDILKLMSVLFILTATIGKAQVFPPSNTVAPSSPGGVFDRVYDNRGHEYNLADWAIKLDNPNSTMNVSSTTTCQAGMFTIFFASGCGMDNPTNPLHGTRRNTVCETFRNISGLFLNGISTWPSSVTVNILIDDVANHIPNSSTSNLGGFATAIYAYPYNPSSANPGIVENQVFKTIKSRVNAWTNVATPLNTAFSQGFYHGFVCFNFNNTGLLWNSSFNVAAASNEIDLMTVCLHEATHMLGVASLISSSGLSIYGVNNNYYSSFDKFLKTPNGVNLLASSGCSGQYGLSFVPNPNVLQPGCPGNYTFDITTCNQACYYSSPNNSLLPIYTPGCFESGSSLSHFEDMCYPTNNTSNNNQYFAMCNLASLGTTRRNYKPEERKVLCDLGYSVSTQYTSNAISAPTIYVGTCSPPNVWGVNDGINSNSVFTFTSTGGPITIPLTSITVNDAAGTTPTCVSSVYSNGTASLVGSNIVFTPNANTYGLGLIQYIPKNAFNNEGNVTYIFVYMYQGSCTPVSPCDMVQNGGFESNNGCGVMSGTVTTNCWAPFTLTPDLYVKNCGTSNPPANLSNNTYNSSINNQPSPFNSYNAATASNSAVLGFGAVMTGTAVTLSESVSNFLGAPLMNNQVYSVTFMAYQFSGAKMDPVGSASVAQVINTASVPVVLSFASSNQFQQTTSSNFPVPTNNVLISATLSNVFNTWQAYTYTFTYQSPNASNGNILYIGTDGLKTQLKYALTVGGQPSTYIYYTLIDDVSIKPLGQAVSFILPTSQICSGQSIPNLNQYVGVPGGTFSGTGVTSSGSGTNTIYNFNTTPSNLPNGFYTITYTYTDQIGCSQKVNQQVKIGNVNSSAVLNYVPANSCVNSGTLSVISPTTGLTYTWQPGNIIANTTPVSSSAATIYTALATIGASCSVGNTILVLPNIPTATILPVSSSACFGTTLTAFGTFTSIVWQPGNYTANPVVVTPTTLTYYTAYVTNSQGCSGTVAVMVLPINGNSLTVVASSPSVCAGGQVTLTAFSNLQVSSYTWSPGGSNTNPTVVTPTANTIYTVNVTTNLFCLGSQTVAVAAPGFSFTASSNTFCTNSIASITAVGNFTSVVWQPGAYVGSTFTTVLTGNQTFTATAYFANGCVLTSTYQANKVDITQSYYINTNYPVTCSGNSETLTVSGTPAFTNVTWLPNNSNANPYLVTPSVSTTYTALVTSTLGCVFPVVHSVTVSNSCCTGTASALPNLSAVNQTITGSKVINGNITMPAGVKITFSGEFRFAPNVKITVPVTSTLSVEGSHLYACGNQMWQGIEVLSGGQVVCKKNVKDNLVEDAIAAINVPSVNTTVNILDITNTTFNKNYTSVNVSSFIQTWTLPVKISKCVFTCRNLPYNATAWPQTGTLSAATGTSADLRYTSAILNSVVAAPYLNQSGLTTTVLLSPYAGQTSQTAIRLIDVGAGVNGALIGDPNLPNDFNLFDSHQTGIESINSSLFSNNNTFQKTLLNGNTTAFGIKATNNYGNTFLYYPVLDLSSPTNPTGCINRFYDCHNGVDATNQASLNARYVYMASSQSTANAAGPSIAGCTGISITSNRYNNYIINNCRFINLNVGIIDNVTNNFLSPTTYGKSWGTFSISTNYFSPVISITNSVNSNYTTYGIMFFNTITSSGPISIGGGGPSDPPAPVISFVPFAPNNGLKIVYNNFYKVQRGVRLESMSDAGFTKTVANNVVVLEATPNAASTQWGIRTNYGRFTSINTNTVTGFGGSTTRAVSAIFVAYDISSGVQCNNVFNVPRGFEFAGYSPGMIWRSNKMSSCNRGMQATSWGMGAQVGGIGQQGAANAPMGNQWLGSWSTNSLQTYVDGTSNAANSKLFVTNTGVTSLNPNFNNGLSPLLSYSVPINRPLSSGGMVTCPATTGGGGMSPGQAKAAAGDTTETGEIFQFMLFIELNMDSLLLNSSDTISNFYEEQQPAEMGILYEIENNLSLGEYTAAQTLLAGFVPESNVQYNLKRYFELYYNYRTLGSISAGDSLDLVLLCNQCPYVDGMAVYKARALHNLIYKTIEEYNDEDCASVGYSARAPRQTETGSEPDPLNNLLAQNESKKIKRTVKNHYKIYPNPATDQLFISGTKAGETLNVIITDIRGKQLLANKIKVEGENNSLKLDLENGIYFVILINQNNNKIVKKLIISK